MNVFSPSLEIVGQFVDVRGRIGREISVVIGTTIWGEHLPVIIKEERRSYGTYDIKSGRREGVEDRNGGCKYLDRLSVRLKGILY